jgi:radical SAM superfamily enzyme YgiQ (UPF0313 family)
MIEGRGFRLRDPEEVVDEIEEAHYKYSATDFEFVDSVLNEPFDHFMEILENICERPWKARFAVTAISPRNLDKKTLDMMWRAGFRSISISPESASMVVSRNYGKSFSVDELRKAAIELNNTRITTWWFFLLGGPGETIETSQETMDFIPNYLTGIRINGNFRPSPVCVFPEHFSGAGYHLFAPLTPSAPGCPRASVPLFWPHPSAYFCFCPTFSYPFVVIVHRATARLCAR